MSSNVDTVLVKNDLIMCSDKLSYAVEMNGSSVSSQKFTATSANSNTHVYTVQVPSTGVIVDRRVNWHCQFKLEITGTVPDGQCLLQVGSTDALGPMPLSQLVNNLQCQINTTTTSVQLNKILDPLMRCMDRKKFSENHNTTPTYLDNCGSYVQLANTDFTGFQNNPLAAYENAFDPLYPPRGSYSIDLITGNEENTTGANQVKTATITYSVTEPIMLSPFCFGDQDGIEASMHGIQNINLTMSLDSTASRMFRWYSPIADKKISKLDFIQNSCWVEFQFITPYSTDLLSSTCITPFSNYVVYPSSSGTPLTSPGIAKLVSNNVQLSSIPDLVIVYVRNQFGNLTPANADAYATISDVSINFNNSNGLLSSASDQLLWRYSREAGSSQSWLEFCGIAAATPSTLANFKNANTVSTSGSVLMLRFGSAIQISDPFYSAGSQGAFNFQLTANVVNNTGATISNPELNLVVVNSGIFISSNGQSSSYTGILTKQMVLDAQLQEPIARTELNRMLGGGFFSRLKSVAHKSLPHLKRALGLALPYVKAELAKSDNKYAKLAHKGIGMAGYGQSGGRLASHLQ